MRILLLTQVVPYPPHSGPKIKTYNVLRYLARQHEVHLISFVRSAAEEMSLQPLRRFCTGITAVPLRRSRSADVAYLARSLVSGRPFLIERDNAKAMHEAARRQAERGGFDAVHADQLSMAQFAVDLPVPLRILDEHNAVWTIVCRAASQEKSAPRRLLAELEWRKLRAYEGAICRRFDLVTVVSGQDYVALVDAARAVFPAHIIPIAIDTREYRFCPPAPEARGIVSVATMFYPPNAEGVYWFASRVYPLIRRQAPEAELYIVGSRPPRKIACLASPSSGVMVTGYVADLQPFLGRSAVWIVPVHSGSGMRVKILEAFARGIPVVSTTVGMEGIAARDGEHLLVADEPDAFADAVLTLLRDPAEAARLARAGRRLVEESYDWRSALNGLDAVYGRKQPVGADSRIASEASL